MTVRNTIALLACLTFVNSSYGEIILGPVTPCGQPGAINECVPKRPLNCKQGESEVSGKCVKSVIRCLSPSVLQDGRCVSLSGYGSQGNGVVGNTSTARAGTYDSSPEGQYLSQVAAGTQLRVTKCPDGEGNYYATGKFPNIKPAVVHCIDIHFRAHCRGSDEYINGLAHNFVGMSGCFGDTYEIKPKPACKVDQVEIEVVEARPCGK